MSDGEARIPLGTQIRGSIALYSFSFGVLAFKVWKWYFAYPDDAVIKIFFGLHEDSTANIGAFVDFFFGWLGMAGLLAFPNIQQVFHHWYRPINLIKGRELQTFFASIPTVILSLVFLIVSFDAVASNWSVRLFSKYEVLVYAPSGQGVSLVNSTVAKAETVRLAKESPVSLLGLRPNQHVVFVVRDKYNLRSLATVCVHRRQLSIDVGRCTPNSSGTAIQDSISGLKKQGPFSIEIYDALPKADARVDLVFLLAKDSRTYTVTGPWLGTGEPRDGRDQAAVGYGDRFFERLYRDREVVATWTNQPSTETDGEHGVAVVIDGYRLRVLFEELRLPVPAGWFTAIREANTLTIEELQERL